MLSSSLSVRGLGRRCLVELRDQWSFVGVRLQGWKAWGATDHLVEPLSRGGNSVLVGCFKSTLEVAEPGMMAIQSIFVQIQSILVPLANILSERSQKLSLCPISGIGRGFCVCGGPVPHFMCIENYLDCIFSWWMRSGFARWLNSSGVPGDLLGAWRRSYRRYGWD